LLNDRSFASRNCLGRRNGSSSRRSGDQGVRNGRTGNHSWHVPWSVAEQLIPGALLVHVVVSGIEEFLLKVGEEKKICYPQTSNTLESEMKEKKATVDSEPCAKTADAKVVKKSIL
jgi:hypothetical protein